MHISYKRHLVIYFMFLCNNQCSVVNAGSSVENEEKMEESKQQGNQPNFVTYSVYV